MSISSDSLWQAVFHVERSFMLAETGSVPVVPVVVVNSVVPAPDAFPLGHAVAVAREFLAEVEAKLKWRTEAGRPASYLAFQRDALLRLIAVAEAADVS